mmetsp:Transcript_31763/g.80995  ORF Transcript_31763/g.80995 Transcript_31763/m.80995 type:complete len:206 (+) Transcript_31763:841-1458(+)
MRCLSMLASNAWRTSLCTSCGTLTPCATPCVSSCAMSRSLTLSSSPSLPMTMMSPTRTWNCATSASSTLLPCAWCPIWYGHPNECSSWLVRYLSVYLLRSVAAGWLGCRPYTRKPESPRLAARSSPVPVSTVSRHTVEEPSTPDSLMAPTAAPSTSRAPICPPSTAALACCMSARDMAPLSMPTLRHMYTPSATPMANVVSLGWQ